MEIIERFSARLVHFVEAALDVAPVRRLIMPILLCAMTSGCASWSTHHYIVGSGPSDYRTRHPIIVAEDDEVVELPVTRYAAGLAKRERQVAISFARRFRSSGSSSLRVQVPTGTANAAAAMRAAHEIRQVLSEQGIEKHKITIVPYYPRGYGHSANVRLAYSTLTAQTNACGNWDDDLMPNNENTQYTNFGCATQNNLAASIAEPADLLGPRGQTEIDATRRDKVIEDYREPKSSATNYQIEEIDLN